MYKKYWFLPLVVVIAAMLFSGCIPVTQAPLTAATSIPSESQAAQVTITVWHQWTGDTLKTIQSMFNQYMAEHLNVTIVLIQPENVTDALKVAIPAMEGPDIIDWTNDQIGSQAQVGNIVDLGMLGVTQDYLKSTYEPAAVKGMIWHGKIWALPESQSGIAIVYNKKLASATDFPSDPMDFSGLLAKAKAFAEANSGKFLICNPGLGNPDAYYEAPIYFGFGMPSFVDDTGKAYLNTPEGIAAGNWIKEFRQYAPTPTSEEICASMFAEGIVAAEWTGPWVIPGIEKSSMDYGILPMGKPFVSLKSLMISQNAVDRGSAEIAVDIIKFLTNQDSERQLAMVNQIIPANTNALYDPQIQALATIKDYGAALYLGIPLANTPYSASQWGPVGDATMAIWNGSQSVSEALTAGQTAIENAISGMK